MTIDVEKLKAEAAALEAERDMARDEIEIQVAKRDRVVARLRTIWDLIAAAKVYAGEDPRPEIPL
ncbi:unnamed protein product [Gemmataceae bacterium]|nr:unnamed protein product [Gemmataceae bacterium]VTU02455.1 unnamed protein product [Gemmataceae bacterium]